MTSNKPFSERHYTALTGLKLAQLALQEFTTLFPEASEDEEIYPLLRKAIRRLEFYSSEEIWKYRLKNFN